MISSHILDELSRLATHYGFIDRGRLIKEISAEALNDACRKSLRAKVTDTRALARVLDEQKVEYKILSETEAQIFATLNVSQLTLRLAKEHCEVLSLQEHDESLESFYLNLLGGAGQ